MSSKAKRVAGKWAIYLGLLGAVLLITFVLDRDRSSEMHGVPLNRLAAAIGAVATLALYSFLFGDNEIYRFLEHMIVGVAAATGFAMTLEIMFKPYWFKPIGQGLALVTGGGIDPVSVIDGRVYWGVGIAAVGFLLIFVFYTLRLPIVGWIVSLLLFVGGVVYVEHIRRITDGAWNTKLLWTLAVIPGSFWYLIYSKRYIWLNRLLIVVLIGAGIGKAFQQLFANLLSQLHGTLKPVWQASVYAEDGLGAALWEGFGGVVFVIVAFVVLFYFVFTLRVGEHPLGQRVHWVARLFMMISFGVVFATVVGTRMGLVVDRIYFLVEEWAKPIVYSWF
ncbi:MAG: hypothetical protein JW889_07855 [Verrucomicrobia bacterium]|nr:hypothetical protein [Verrucomicrobiota bacterium]